MLPRDAAVMDLDVATRELTAYADLADFLTDRGLNTGYFPTCYVGKDPRMELLADAYDTFQAQRGDARRAYRHFEHDRPRKRGGRRPRCVCSQCAKANNHGGA
jgi:hypothetical protein